jgi:Iodothyronine deiodinase
VAFLVVYIREAHPEDGWVLAENRRADIAVNDSRTTAARVGLARACSARFELEIPVVADDIGDEVTRRYGGWPDRLYLIGRDGRIAYQGSPGPFGFRPDELEAAIERELSATR